MCGETAGFTPGSLRLFCDLLLPMYSNAPVSLVEDGIVSPTGPYSR